LPCIEGNESDIEEEIQQLSEFKLLPNKPEVSLTVSVNSLKLL